MYTIFNLLILLIFLPIFCSSVLAGPSITEVTGAFQNGQTVTILGASFGKKSQAPPLISSYNHPIVANNWSNGSFGGNWVTAGMISLTNSSPRISISQSSYKAIYDTNGSYATVRYNHATPEDKIYVSFWMYRDYASWNILTGSGNNNKFFRLYENATGRGDVYLSAVSNKGNGNCDQLAIIGEGNFYTGYSIAYTACSVFKYVAPMFDVRSLTCLPQLRQWDHYEIYLDYPTNRGGNDSSAILIMNGKTHSRTNSVTFDYSDSTNDVRWFRFGLVSGARTTSGKEYIDQVYIDNTQTHVFISDRPNVIWPDSGVTHHSEIQVPSAWSDSSITITFNQGSFANDKTVYLYIVDANGNISNGYPLTTGKAGHPPNPPTGLRIPSN